MATKQTIVNGNQLQLFDASGNSFAFATNHTLTINGETSDVSSKDHGIWSAAIVNRVSWEISTENLFALKSTSGTEFDDLLTNMTSRQEVTVYFGFRTETGATYSGATQGDGLEQGNGNIDAAYWTADPTKPLYKGTVIITALTLNANNGENASYSATLTGVGSLTKVTSIGD